MTVTITGTNVDGVDVSAHTADLDAHTKDAWEIMRTGEYTAGGAVFATTAALVANRLYAAPIVFARAVTIDRLAIDIKGGGAGGSKARLGIYNNGVNLYPGTLVIDGGEVAADAAVFVAATINQSLTKGVYWFAIISDSTPTIAISFIYNNPPMILGLANGNFGSANRAWDVAQAYGALPDPFTAGGGYVSNFMCVPRIASLD